MEVEDRKEEPSSKGVVVALYLLRRNQTQFQCQFQRNLFPLEMLNQSIPTFRGIPQPVLFNHLLPDVSLGQIPSSLFAFPPPGEEIIKIFRGDLVDLKKHLP